jgi:TonB family protein
MSVLRNEPVRLRIVVWGVLLGLLGLFAAVMLRTPRLPDAAPPPEPRLGAIVSEEVVALRSAPDAQAESLATLHRGDRVSVAGEQGAWMKISVASKAVGYVPTGSLERSEDRLLRVRRAATVFAFHPMPGFVTDKTWLLLAPLPFAPRYGEVDRGASLPIYSVDHAYYATKLPDGSLGYIATSDIDIIAPNPAEPALSPARARTPKDIAVSEETSSTPAPEPPESSSSAPGLPSPPAPAVNSPIPVAPVEQAVSPPVLVAKVDPIYPAAARQAGVEGTVILQISIAPEGNVSEVRVRRGLPLGLTEAAIAAVRQWRYRPAFGPRGPIPSARTVRIDFRLTGPGPR